MSQSPEITARSWVAILFTALCWGSAFPLVEVALTGITPFWLAACRIGLGTLLSVVVWGAFGFRLFSAPLTRGDLWLLVVVGVLSSALPFTLISWGQQYTTAGFTGVAMASVALMVLPMAHYLVPGERLTWRKAAGFLLGFVGVLVLMGPDPWRGGGGGLELAGQLACLAAAGCYATSSVMMRRLPPVDPVGLSTVLLAIGAAWVLPLAWIQEGPPELPGGGALVALVLLGVFPTAIANLLRVVVIRSAGPVFMSLTNYQVPLWSVGLGVVLLGEPLHLSLLLAAVLILAGVALSQYGALKRLFVRGTV